MSRIVLTGAAVLGLLVGHAAGSARAEDGRGGKGAPQNLPGTTVADVEAAVAALPPETLFINYTTNTFISPTTPVTGLSNAQNRIESVGFLEKGTCLVICNVTPHLLDGMIAVVRVVGDDEDDHADHEAHGRD